MSFELSEQELEGRSTTSEECSSSTSSIAQNDGDTYSISQESSSGHREKATGYHEILLMYFDLFATILKIHKKYTMEGNTELREKLEECTVRSSVNGLLEMLGASDTCLRYGMFFSGKWKKVKVADGVDLLFGLEKKVLIASGYSPENASVHSKQHRRTYRMALHRQNQSGSRIDHPSSTETPRLHDIFGTDLQMHQYVGIPAGAVSKSMIYEANKSGILPVKEQDSDVATLSDSAKVERALVRYSFFFIVPYFEFAFHMTLTSCFAMRAAISEEKGAHTKAVALVMAWAIDLVAVPRIEPEELKETMSMASFFKLVNRDQLAWLWSVLLRKCHSDKSAKALAISAQQCTDLFDKCLTWIYHFYPMNQGKLERDDLSELQFPVRNALKQLREDGKDKRKRSSQGATASRKSKKARKTGHEELTSSQEMQDAELSF
ncbi:Hypothetical Protein FCC1311_039352 [Hondaea fermentalgiana]|uniref:Uncharacterized protein n=1 Tax=Hondaea fermentalgiana TaxID=2315210 RepID=A0A2R5G9H1_9STRA|nr:Hypothetical Protein FCC1311_039352 [Hondaea fermentalgiana]|eukprot:GBG27712.1 Hypothetical Protein FCC1311_039352 [Hondaea fermentalgiana]